MKNNNFKRVGAAHIFFSLLLGMVSVASWAQQSVNDLAGRQVILPKQIERVAILGAVAPLNSFMFMLGKGATIRNGLPPFFQSPYWMMQRRLGPKLAEQPVIASGDGQPNIEALLMLEPDVVLASSPCIVAALEASGLPTLLFQWNGFEDLMRSAELMGEALHVEKRAHDFRSYCDDNVVRVKRVLDNKPVSQRKPRVAFLRLKTLSQPARIADWMLSAAGGENIGQYSLTSGQVAMTQEMLLKSDPEILIVWSRRERDELLSDPRFAAMTAVRSQQVRAVPVGATPWLAPGVEQCLGVLWVAKQLHPESFRDIDLVQATRDFYHRFFETVIDVNEARAILNGMD